MIYNNIKIAKNWLLFNSNYNQILKSYFILKRSNFEKFKKVKFKEIIFYYSFKN